MFLILRHEAAVELDVQRRGKQGKKCNTGQRSAAHSDRALMAIISKQCARNFRRGVGAWGASAMCPNAMWNQSNPAQLLPVQLSLFQKVHLVYEWMLRFFIHVCF